MHMHVGTHLRQSVPHLQRHLCVIGAAHDKHTAGQCSLQDAGGMNGGEGLAAATGREGRATNRDSAVRDALKGI